MITENLSTLKIHKLTQEQYNRALENGTLDDNALYLTPDKSDEYATKAELEALRTEILLLISSLEEVKEHLNI